MLFVLLGLTACGPGFHTTFSTAPGPARPAVAAAAVRVLDERGPTPSPLPDGLVITRTDSYFDRGLTVAADYPTAAEPNRWIGDLEIRGLQYDPGPASLLPDLAAEAGAHGANTVVVLNSHKAVALWLSPAAPVRPPVDQLTAEAQAQLAGYTAGPVQTVQLQDVALQLTAAKGHCYAVIVALDPAAEWSTEAHAAGLEVSLRASAGWLAAPRTPNNMIMKGTATAPRSAAIELACALEDTAADLEFGRSFDYKPLRALGTGAAHLVILDKTLAPPALAALERGEISAFMFDSIPDHHGRALGERDCIVCAGTIGACRTHDVEACAPLQACLLDRKHGTHVSYCLRPR